MIYISQIIMLYTINLSNAVCKLYLNKTGRKKIFNKIRSDINSLTFYRSTLKWSEVTHLCPTLCDPMACSPPGS